MGKRLHIYLATIACLLLPWTTTAQCPSSSCGSFPACPPSDIPQNAPLVCSILDLDGYQGSTAGYTAYPNVNFGSNCNGGTIENNQFIAFIAPSTQVDIQVSSFNCTNGNGIQAQVYYSPDCASFQAVSNCWAIGAPGTGVLNATGLVPGEIYLLMIDGWAGDICDFTLTILSGGGNTGPLPPPGPISGQDSVCATTNPPLLYSVDPVPGATNYTWTITPPFGSIIGTPTNTASIQWNTPAGTSAIICVTAENACETSPPSCTTVYVSDLLVGQEEQDLCLGDCTVCAGQQICSPGVYTVTVQNYLGCDSLVTCIINPIAPAINDLGDITQCAPYTLIIDNQSFSTSQANAVTIQGGSWQGCDSTVLFNLCILEATAQVAPPPLLGCAPGATVTLNGSASSQNSGPCDSITYSWSGPAGGLIGPTDSLIATAALPGQYCLTVTNSRNGVTCTDQMCVDVVQDVQIPNPPLLSGPTDVCANNTYTYVATSSGGPIVDTFLLDSVPANATINFISTDTFTITYSSNTSGLLCVSAQNDCGTSTPTCITPIIGNSPIDPLIIGQDTVCAGDVVTYQLDTCETGATITWTVPSGASFVNNGCSIDVNYTGASSGDICVTVTNNCGSSNQICLPVTVNDLPATPVFLSGDTLLCDGFPATYCVSTVANADDYTWTTPIGNFTNTECLTLDWTGSSGGQVCVTANNTCGSSTPICFDVVVYTSPTATLSAVADTAFCPGDSVALSISFTGQPPWSIARYLDGTLLDTLTNITTNPFLYWVQTGGTYSLGIVTDASGCANNGLGQATIIANSTPTASISGGGGICVNTTQTAIINFSLTGTAPWTISWTRDGSTLPPLTIDSLPFSFSTTQAGTYEVTSVTDANGCIGSGNGSQATVFAITSPTVSNIQTNCDNTSTSYIVSFEITGGDSTTYTIVPATGTLDTTANPAVFTSDPIPSGSGYSFLVFDANMCDTIAVADNQVLCNCLTAAGTIDLTPIEVCGDGPNPAPTYDNSNEVLDGNDILQFILHEGSANTIINEVARSNTPVFTLNPANMTYGQTYYISPVAGNNLGGNVDLTDGCTDVNQGTPITFYEIPTATLSGNTAVCQGDNATLSVIFTGSPPWNISFQDDQGNAPQSISGITTDTFDLIITQPSVSATYTLTSVSNDFCTGTTTGTGIVTVYDAPILVSATTTCNSTNTAYTVTIEFTGGDTTTYSVNPMTGTLDTSTDTAIFVSDPIPAGTGYTFTIYDANLCDSFTVSAPIVDCQCTSTVGDLNTDLIEVCGSQNNPAPNYDPTNQVFDGDDVLNFVLYVPPFQASNVVQTNSFAPTFAFDPNTMVYGTVYQIAAIVGSDDGSGLVDLNDPCLDRSAAAPVVWYETPTADLSGDQAVCMGDSATLQVMLTGSAPWTISWMDSDGNTQTVSGINSSPFSFNVFPNSGSVTYSLVSASDQYCAAVASGTAVVNTNLPPSASMPQITFNGTNTGFTVCIDLSGGDTTTYQVNGLAGSFVTATQWCSTEQPCGSSFSLSIDDGNGCGPIVVSDGPIACNCTSTVGDMDTTTIEVCGSDVAMGNYDAANQVLDGNDTLCFILHDGSGLNGILASAASPAFSYFPGVNYETTYYISAVVGDYDGVGCVDFSDPCIDVSAGQPVIFHQEPTATLSQDASICMGDSTLLTVTFNSAPAPWSITYTITGGDTITVTDITDNPYEFFAAPLATSVYTLIDVSNNYCIGTPNGLAVVTVNEPPSVVNIAEDCDSTLTNYSVSFQIVGGDPSSYLILPPSAGSLTTSAPYIFTSNPIPSGQGYYFLVDDSSGCGPVVVEKVAYDCGCLSSAGIMSTNLLQLCTDEVAYANYNTGSQVFDGNDSLMFILHTQNTQDINNTTIISVSTQPAFSFIPGSMQEGITYYISAVVGDGLPNGQVDLNDDCLSVSQAQPVVFYPLPTVNVNGTTTICKGDQASITFNTSGNGATGYMVYFTLNGVADSLLINGDTYVLTDTFPSTTTVALLGIMDLATGCSNAANGEVTITVNEPLSAGTAIAAPAFCANDNQVVNLDNLLSGADLGGTWYDLNGTAVSNQFYTNGQAPGQYIFVYQVDAPAPCPDDQEAVAITIHPLPQADAGPDQELNCNVTEVSLGGPNTSPGMQYEWIGNVPNPNDPMPQGITEPGTYTLVVTDPSTGCTQSDVVEITRSVSAPEPDFQVAQISCFGNQDGYIAVTSVTGGAPPYVYSFNGGPFTTQSQWSDLGPGQVSIAVQDSKGCEFEATFTIEEPEELNVDLIGNFEGDEQVVTLGDSVRLQVQVSLNVPFDSIDQVIWSPRDSVPCDTCQYNWVTPTGPITYSVTVIENGCSDSDQLHIEVARPRPVFIPSAFSPNGDGANDYFQVFVGPQVRRIKQLAIYNRWGELLFSKTNFAPNDPEGRWDGTLHGKPLNSQVLVYMIEVEFIDGVIKTYKGDVTLLR